MVLFVGNLNVNVTNSDLLRLFTECGTVQAAQIITDDRTRRSRGFGFVHMEDRADADRAIHKLHNSVFMEHMIVVTDKGPRHAVRSSFTPPLKKSK